jgi:hypothetical protein
MGMDFVAIKKLLSLILKLILFLWQLFLVNLTILLLHRFHALESTPCKHLN